MAKIDIARKPNESALAYHKRIVYGKLVDKTLGDVDYTELSELAYGQSYSSDVARRMFYGSKRTLELISAEEASKIDDVNILSELDEKMIELRKERQKFYDQRNAFNKIVRERSRQEELNEIIIDAIHNGELPRLNYERNIIEPSSNDLLVSLNDLHYGAVHSNYWNEYNSDIAKDMMANYLDRIINIADTHNSENCIVWENGDAISGAIHRSIQITNKENVIEQVMGASELIAEFIAELSKHFRTVKFVSVSGNHSRIDPNKDNALVDERLDDLIEWYIAARLQNFENVEIGAGEKIDSTLSIFEERTTVASTVISMVLRLKFSHYKQWLADLFMQSYPGICTITKLMKSKELKRLWLARFLVWTTIAFRKEYMVSRNKWYVCVMKMV